MMQKLLLACSLLALTLTASLAQSESLSIALLRFGPVSSSTVIQDNFLRAIASQGLIGPEDLLTLQGGQSVESEGLSVYLGDAQFDFATAQTLVGSMLDKDVDVMITISTPMTQLAVNATVDLDEPPAVLFAEVIEPYAAGLGQASCIKPAHVTGVSIVTPYADILPLLLLQDPAIETIGVIYSSSEVAGVEGAAHIAQAAGALGLSVHESAVTSVAELSLAAESLAQKGVEALVIPSDQITVAGLPVLMTVAIENSLPVFHSSFLAMSEGVTVAAGTTLNSWQANILGAIVGAYLEGEIDLAAIGFGELSNLEVGVNLDLAADQQIELSEALLEQANTVVQDGRLRNMRVESVLESMDWDDETKERVRREFATFGRRRIPIDQLSPETQQLSRMVMGSAAAGSGGGAAKLFCLSRLYARANRRAAGGAGRGRPIDESVKGRLAESPKSLQFQVAAEHPPRPLIHYALPRILAS